MIATIELSSTFSNLQNTMQLLIEDADSDTFIRPKIQVLQHHNNMQDIGTDI